MRTEPPASLRQLLAVMQLSDGGLPIGRFAHSGGLESWFQGRRSVGEEELAGWVEASLRFGAARTDGVATAEAHRAAAGGDIAALIAFDVALGTYKLSEAARRASTACGRQLAALAPQLFDDALMAEFCAAVRTDRSPGHLAVVAGAVTAAAGLNVEQAVLMEARGVVGMHLSAAVRLGTPDRDAGAGGPAQIGAGCHRCYRRRARSRPRLHECQRLRRRDRDDDHRSP